MINGEHLSPIPYFRKEINMDICNVTKLPCAYCNPVCEHRVNICLCEEEDDDVKITKNDSGRDLMS